jgi:hypothetical protein
MSEGAQRGATMSAFAAAKDGVRKKTREVTSARCARTKFPLGLFGLRHDGVEKKFNRTGGTAGKDPCGWLGSARNGDEDSVPPHRIPRRAQGEATKPAAAIAGAKICFVHDLFCPFCRRLEFCMLLNSGYLA